MRRVLALAGALLAGLILLAPPPATAAARGELAPIMLVLDASGSMTGRAPGGTRMDAAKRAVRTVVDTVPAGAQMGLTVYGTGTGSSPGEKAAGCKDIKVVHPVGPLDKDGIVRAAQAAIPRGYTPIGQSLRTAAGALPKEGPRSIVLVSDGEDTCAPPEPCEVAKELSQQGVELRIHTVGYQVDGKAKKQLTCIAQSTGGTYTNVPDPAELGQALSRVTASALRNYQPAGTPVRGTPEIKGAPALKPGNSLDTIGFVRKRYYGVDIPQGHTAYFSATVPFERGGSHSVEGLNLSLYGPGGADCNQFENEIVTQAADGESVTTALTWDGVARGDRPANEACRKPGRYTFAVYFTRAADTGSLAADDADRVPVEIQLGLEPPASGDLGPVPTEQVVGFTAPAGPDRPVTGGGSFGTAATLPGSGRYVEQMRFGEYLFYRVRLNWGQGLAYKVHYPASPDMRAAAANIESTLHNPARSSVAWSTTAFTGGAATLPGESDSFSKGKGYFGTVPIRYRNRELSGDNAALSVAGWYYIAVKLGRLSSLSDQSTAAPLPVLLEVSVVGTPEKGPQYAGTPAQDSFGAPPGVTQSPTATKKIAADSDDTPWPLIGGAAAAVAIGAAVAVLLFTRRRRPSHPGPQFTPPGPGPGGPPFQGPPPSPPARGQPPPDQPH